MHDRVRDNNAIINLMKRQYNLLFCIVAILFLSQCGRIEPVAPEIVVEEIPALIQKESSVYMPIRINLQPYLNDAENTLAMTFNGNEQNCSGVSYSYKFIRNPIHFEGMGDYLYYQVDGKYSLNLNYCPECTSLFDEDGTCLIPRIYVSCGVGEPMRRVSVGYTTKFKISPDFKFKTITELRKFETIDPCEISVFKYDATDQLRKELLVVLKDLEKDIDDQMYSIDFRTEIENTWDMLCQSTSLGKYGFICINPKAISLSDIQFDKKQAFIDLNMVIQPTVTTYPPTPVISSLPLLTEHKKAKGFDVNLDIIASYDSLSSILTSEMSGKKVVIKNNEVIFKKIEIHGASNKQLNLEVHFEGKRKGTLFLVGTPVFDTVQQIITFPNLSFDLKTKNALLKSAKWLFSSKITDVMRTNATFDLKPHLANMQAMIEREMNREITPGINLAGHIQSISLQEIFPNHTNLVIRVNSKGELTLFM